MPNRRLIYLSAHHLTAYRWQAGVLSREASFEASDSGKAAFASYLTANARYVFSILANVAEEGFHIEMIPFLRGADRQAILTRKLGQIFFNTTLTTSLSLGYERTRRKDERILLAALTNFDVFAPWLAAMTHAETALAGLYSLPLLAADLLRRLGVAEDRCLLLTIQDQSVRQSYFENGALHFSRLTPLNNSSIGGIAQTFAAEAFKLQQYLVSQRLLGRRQPITAYLLAHAHARAAIDSSCVNSETLSFVVLDIEQAARKCRLQSIPEDTRCETVFLNLLAVAAPRVQFAAEPQRHFYHLHVTRSILQSAGAVVLLACLLLSGKQLFDAYRLNAQAEALRGETGVARQRYEEIVKSFPAIPTTHENLRGAINRYTQLERASTLPEGLFREISRALQSAPAVELDAIEWKAGVASPIAPEAPRSVSPQNEDETAIVRGTVRLGGDNKPRQVLETLHRLVDALRQNPQLVVEVLQQPFDVESGKLLKGGDAEVEANEPRSFKVQIRVVNPS